MERAKFYINLHNKVISETEPIHKHGLAIHATQKEVKLLRRLFNQLDSADFSTFLRSFVPIKPYHEAESNHQFNESYHEVSKMLHELGDENTRQFIQDNGVLGNRPIKTNRSASDNDRGKPTKFDG